MFSVCRGKGIHLLGVVLRGLQAQARIFVLSKGSIVGAVIIPTTKRMGGATGSTISKTRGSNLLLITEG